MVVFAFFKLQIEPNRARHLMKILKIIVPYVPEKNLLHMAHSFFRVFIVSASQNMKRKIYCQNIGANTSFQ